MESKRDVDGKVLGVGASHPLIEVIRRAHAGRWPTWKMHDLQRVGDAVIELAQWRQGRSYRAWTVLVWRRDGDVISVSWQPGKLTQTAALELFGLMRLGCT